MCFQKPITVQIFDFSVTYEYDHVHITSNNTTELTSFNNIDLTS